MLKLLMVPKTSRHAKGWYIIKKKKRNESKCTQLETHEFHGQTPKLMKKICICNGELTTNDKTITDITWRGMHLLHLK